MEFGQYSPITYTRDLRIAPTDPNSLYVSIGASARSSQGALYRSRDLFKTFERVDRGITANATMMAVSVDPRAPSHIYCIARDGQVFGTLDDGATWTTHQLPDKAKELRGLAAG